MSQLSAACQTRRERTRHQASVKSDARLGSFLFLISLKSDKVSEFSEGGSGGVECGGGAGGSYVLGGVEREKLGNASGGSRRRRYHGRPVRIWRGIAWW